MVLGVTALLALPPAALAGSGIFRGAGITTIPSNASGIAAEDVDGDGLVDVVTSNAGPGGNEVAALLGDGDGGFFGPERIALDHLPYGMLLTDLDGDGIHDLTLAFGDRDGIAVMKGRGDEDLFDPPGEVMPAGQRPRRVATAELTGDAVVDLVVANEGGDSVPGSVAILRGVGGGRYEIIPQVDPGNPDQTVSALETDLGTRGVAIGDLDDDLHPDVVAINTFADSASIFAGSGGGAFSPHDDLTFGRNPSDLRLVDLDADDVLDLVVAETNEDAVAVRLGVGDGRFAPASSLRVGVAPTQLAIGDLDGDQVLDIVTANTRSGDVSVLLGDGTGGFGRARTYVADAEPFALTLADFDADGLPEPIVAAQGQSGSAAMLRNRGGGVLHAPEAVAVGAGPEGVAAADVDGDALVDLVVSRPDGLTILRALAGGGFGAPSLLPLAGRGIGVVARDLDGDGWADLAVADHLNHRLAVAFATGGGRFAAFDSYPVEQQPGALTAGDFNGDGRLDLATAAIGPPVRVSVLLQRPGGRFDAARSVELVGEMTPAGIAALDANCDGHDDLVVANQASRSVSVLRSAGDGTFSVVQTVPASQAGEGPASVAVADFDRDGVDDFAVGNFHVPPSSRGVRTFRGSCTTGAFTAQSSVLAGDAIGAMVARDLTGDGLVDIGVANQSANVIRVLSGRGDGTFIVNTADIVGRMPIAMAAGDVDGDGQYDAVTVNGDASSANLSVLTSCVGEAHCRSLPPRPARLRGDGNGDARRSAADLVAVAAEVMDGDGAAVESVGGNRSAESMDGVDGNGDGWVDAQDRVATTRLIFVADAPRDGQDVPPPEAAQAPGADVQLLAPIDKVWNVAASGDDVGGAMGMWPTRQCADPRDPSVTETVQSGRF